MHVRRHRAPPRLQWPAQRQRHVPPRPGRGRQPRPAARIPRSGPRGGGRRGTGPTDGTNGTTCTPGPFNLARVLQAAEDLPANLGIMGKGNCSLPGALDEQNAAGAAALKVHEDWGSTPAVIDNALAVADHIQIALHTDTLNESGFFEDPRSAIDGRTIHTFHSEGAGGGHAPGILRVTGEPTVLPSSTNATLPYTKNSVDGLLDMVMVCHHLSHDIPEDVAFADSRVRAETIAAETVLHDRGIISMISSDSQATGRIGESVTRAFQIAHVCKEAFGPLPEDSERNDNQRVLRYLAKVTINPAIASGVSDHVGSIEPGRLADIVLWPVHSFGAKSITPACGEIDPAGALLTGLAAGAVCAYAVTVKYRLDVDDTLDVVGVHGAGGLVGLVMVDLFATADVSGKEGLFYGGGFALLWRQAVAILAVAAFSFVLTWIIAKAVDTSIGFMDKEAYPAVPGQDEERAYDLRTAERLDALIAGDRGPGRQALVEIRRMLRDHREG